MDVSSDALPDASSVSERSALSELPPRTAGGEHAGGEGEQILRTFAGRLSHRLLGLVNSIEGYTDLLAYTLGTEEQRELSLRILEGTARIEGIVRDLRRFSEPVDPVVRAVTARQLVDSLRDMLGAERWLHVDVKWEVAERPHELLGDPILLRQALLVLLQNAFEATPGRPVRLVIAADAERTQFAVWNEGGIAGSDPHEKIFEPFFSTKGPHLGIGLSLARRIAEAHGGILELTRSDDEAGTWFALEVPQESDQMPDRLVLSPRRQ